ncbi:SDR family oxidoreductase [soil metagenome]
MPLTIDLSGKIALVTGATGDLGCIMARTLAQCGAAVAVHFHKNRDGAVALCAEIGGKAFAVQADVTDSASVLAMRDAVGSALGAPDIIVNNAVVQYPWTSVLEQGLEDYESQFRSSVMHNVLMAKAFVPAMQKKGWGRVIAINTECAMQCYPSQSAYVSGKRGMDGVLRVLAKEIGKDGITVNQVAPGWMNSKRTRAGDIIGREAYTKQVPLGHGGEDQDIANAVAFLASDLAAFIHGVYLPVCGGNVMPGI